MSDRRSKTVTAENQFTEAMELKQNEGCLIDINPTNYTGTVTFQRRTYGQSAWDDVTFDAAGTAGWDMSVATNGIHTSYLALAIMEVRIGVKTGDHAGTSVICRLEKPS